MNEKQYRTVTDEELERAMRSVLNQPGMDVLMRALAGDEEAIEEMERQSENDG